MALGKDPKIPKVSIININKKSIQQTTNTFKYLDCNVKNVWDDLDYEIREPVLNIYKEHIYGNEKRIY